MSRFIIGLILVLAILWLVRSRGPVRIDRDPGASAVEALRAGVLSRSSLSGLAPAAPGSIRGTVMDWNLGDGLATLVAIDDGSVSLYLKPGGGVIGAGSHAEVAHAAEAFRQAAISQRTAFHESTTFPAPGRDSVVFYLLTDSATLSSGSIAANDLQQSSHPFAALGNAAQLLLTQVRQVK